MLQDEEAFRPRGRTPSGSDPAARTVVIETTQTSTGEAAAPEVWELIEPLITVREAAVILGVTPRTVYVWASEGRIPHYKPAGMTLRFRGSELEAWIQLRAVRPRRTVQPRR